MNHPISQRIEISREANSESTFVIPVELFGPAYLKVTCWMPEDSELDDECVRQVDLYADRACTKLIAEDIAWGNLPDTDGLFLEIRTQQFKREDRLRLAGALRLDPVFDSVFGGAQ